MITTYLSTPDDVLEGTSGDAVVSDQLYGFGGLHGGMSVALATRHLLDAVNDEAKPLRSLHARFARPIRGSLRVGETRHTSGRLVDVASVEVTSGDRVALSVEGTFGRASVDSPQFTREMPSVAAPEDCEEFAVPPEFVPFGQFLEIRPTTTDRPFAAGANPTLQAWIRLRGDEPVDLLRLIIVLDALAPSAAATLSQLIAIPTIEFTVRPAAGLSRSRSPWILLDTASTVSDDGWVHEAIDAWSAGGEYLGSATQLRVMTAP